MMGVRVSERRQVVRIRGLMLAAALVLTGCYVYPDPYGPSGHVVVTGPPRVAVGVGGIYYADGYDDVFYYNGWWYYVDGPYWYRCSTWGSTWVYVASPPRVFLSIPPSHPRYSVVLRHPLHPGYNGYRTRTYPKYTSPRPSLTFQTGARRTTVSGVAGRSAPPRKPASSGYVKGAPPGKPRSPLYTGKPKRPSGSGLIEPSGPKKPKPPKKKDGLIKKK